MEIVKDEISHKKKRRIHKMLAERICKIITV